jgi:hypothetical protein
VNFPIQVPRDRIFSREKEVARLAMLSFTA